MSPPKIIALVLLISLMFGTGLQVDRRHMLAVFKNYWLMLGALIANFVIVPILGAVLVRLFHLSDEVATGVLLMAIAPGVPFVVLAGGRKKGGSLGFAITLAIILPALSLITIPITAPLVLPAGEAASVPPGHLLPLLLFQVVPLLIGAIVGDRAPDAAAKLVRPFTLLTLLSLIVLLVMLAPAIAKSVGAVYGTRGILTELILVVLSVATGWILGGANAACRHTLAAGTALRNVGLAAVIATDSFAGTAASAVVMTYLLVQAIVVALVGAIFKRTAEAEEAS